nr:MAG TPA: hypothetical protein [Caudoviricetes sp.]
MSIIKYRNICILYNYTKITTYFCIIFYERNFCNGF